MSNQSRPPLLQINRNTLLAAVPIFFLFLLALWTILTTSVSPVKAQSSSYSAFAVVKRSSANLREGPGTQYRIVGMSRKGATLPIIGKYDDEFGRRWYKVYLRALGDVWVSGTVVTITTTNEEIPDANPSQANSILTTPVPTEVIQSQSNTGNSSGNSSNSGNSGSSGSSPAATNPPPQPTAVPQQPATTPDPGV